VGFDGTAEEFPLTVLPRIGERFFSTRQNHWSTDLPQNGKKALQKTVCQSIEERVQRRRDAIVEHAKTSDTQEKCKNLGTAGKNPLWCDADCCSDEACQSQAVG
jgi:hypothetical protein